MKTWKGNLARIFIDSFVDLFSNMKLKYNEQVDKILKTRINFEYKQKKKKKKTSKNRTQTKRYIFNRKSHSLYIIKFNFNGFSNEILNNFKFCTERLLKFLDREKEQIQKKKFTDWIVNLSFCLFLLLCFCCCCCWCYKSGTK